MGRLPQQLTMFGVEANPEVAFHLFHDESGTYVPGAGDRWLLHCVLFLPASKQSEVFTALQEARQKTGYFEEVHYQKLRQSVPGPKAQCATNWLRLYVGQFSEFCFFHCLAVDTHSPGFQHDRFREAYHVYNYFTRVAVVGGIAWSLKQYQRVALKFHSHAKSRPDGDNFATYVPSEVYNWIEEKRSQKPTKYLKIRLLRPEVVSVVSDPAEVNPELRQECELIQLVDLMTSSIAQAITDRTEQKSKIALAEMIASWIVDTRKPLWLQTEELHRRFSLSCFPDKRGRFYNPTLAVTERNQLPLLEEDV